MASDRTPSAGNSDDLAVRLGRGAARLFRAAKPRVERAIAEAGPKATQAGKQAIDYAREHEDEIKATTSRLLRSRVSGPLGLVVDAFAQQSRPALPPSEIVCPRCQAHTPLPGNFCTQCGVALPK